MHKQSMIQSLFSAFRGIKHTLRERNFIIMLLAAFIAISRFSITDLPKKTANLSTSSKSLVFKAV